MKKGKKYGLVLLAVLAAAWNALVFGIPHRDTAAFWVGYGFTMLAFLLQIAVALAAFGSRGELFSERTFLGLSVARYGVLYLAAQAVWGLITAFVPVFSGSVSAVVSVLLLALFGAAALLSKAGGELAAAAGERVRVNTAFIQSLSLQAEALASKERDPELKKRLEKLAERIRYTDPVSGQGLSKVEAQIDAAFRSLCRAEKEQAQELCEELERLLEERARQCRLLK